MQNVLKYTASPKVLKNFSHPQTRGQSQVVQNDKLSQECVETKIFVGGKPSFYVTALKCYIFTILQDMWQKYT